MTTEHRVIFDLVDIGQLRIQCARCQASVVLPISDESIRVPEQCPGCRETWKDSMRPGPAAIIEVFATAFKQMRAAATTPCTLRFEVASPSTPPASR